MRIILRKGRAAPATQHDHMAARLQHHFNSDTPYPSLPYTVRPMTSETGDHMGFKVTRPGGAGGHTSARITPFARGKKGIAYPRRSNFKGDQILANHVKRHLETFHHDA